MKKAIITAVASTIIISAFLAGCSAGEQSKSTTINESASDSSKTAKGSSNNSKRQNELIEAAKYEEKEIKPIERNLFYNGVILGSSDDRRWYLLNDKGEKISHTYYEISQYISEGLIMAFGNGGWGFLHTSGDIVIAPQFEGVKNFGNGLAGVKVFDQTIAVTDNGSTQYIKKYKWGFIDKTGKMVIEPQYEDVERFTDGLCPVKSEGKYGYINTNGEMVIKNQYDTAENFVRGTAIISIDGGYALIDKKGAILTETKFSSIEYDKEEFLSNGLYRVKLDGKDGFIEVETGKTIIHPKYDWVQNFKEGVAIAGNDSADSDGNKYIYIIDRDGNSTKVDCKHVYSHVYGSGFKNGILQITDNKSHSQRINKSGEILTSEEVEMIRTYFKEIDTHKSDSGKIAFVDTNFNPLSEYKYDFVHMLKSGISVVAIGDSANNKYGLVNSRGKEITEVKYDEVWGPYSDGHIYGLIKNEDETSYLDVLAQDGSVLNTLSLGNHDLNAIRHGYSNRFDDLSKVISKLYPYASGNPAISKDGYYIIRNRIGSNYGVSNTIGDIIIQPDHENLAMLVDIDAIFNVLNKN